jgi:Helix-turn-helix domain
VGTCSDLTPASKLVLTTLAQYVNSEDHTAWPDFDTLAADTSVGRRTVIRAINAGRKLGIIRRIYKGGKRNGRGKSNRYIFMINREHSANLAPCPQNPADSADTVPFTSEHSANYASTQCQLRLDTVPI